MKEDQLKLSANNVSRRAVLAALAGTAGNAIAQKIMPGNQIGFKSDNDPFRTECGVGALMPWADGLYASTYNSSGPANDTGLGLYRIEEDLKMSLVDAHHGVYANRFIHHASNQCIIGPYIIDAKGKATKIDEMANYRITSTFAHLTDPDNRVYFQTMEGLFIEMDVSDRKTRVLFDLRKDFGITKAPHFKGGYTAQKRVVVSNNGFFGYGQTDAGLFEWDGIGKWKRISDKPHMDVMARNDFGNVMFSTGWDERSVLLEALVDGTWQRYRLPKASHAFEHGYQTEWMRIREVETEHFMMDIQGMFYELQPFPFEGRIWGVKPVCQHLRTIPDYCSFRGTLAVAGNETSPNRDSNNVAGQAQSGIWFGKTDDLWSWGRPQGWGGPWRKDAVTAGKASDPFLFLGFEHKMLHLLSDKACNVDIEIDFLGNGTWVKYETVRLAGGSYQPVIFPDAFSAQWIRLVPGTSCTLTAEFMFS